MKSGSKGNDGATIYRVPGFTLDPAGRTLRNLRGKRVRLPARAFDILMELVRNAGRAVSREALMEVAWRGRIVEESSLNRAISSVRRALGDDAGSPRFIATLPGVGYQFIASVEISAPEPGIATRPSSGSPGFSWRGKLVTGFALVAVVAGGLWWSGDRQSQPAAGGALVDLEVLTDFQGSHSDPTLSPDGEWLAFASDASGTSQIWAMSLEDRVARQLTFEEAPAFDPSWSPTGQRIVYQVEGALAVVNPLGSSPPRRLLEGGASNPSFAPGGDWLVYEWGVEIRRAQSDGSGVEPIEGVPARRFPHARATPVISPDGSQIAYFMADSAVMGDFWRIPATGGDPLRLTRDNAPAGGLDWFPDGGALIVSSMRGGRLNLWRVALDGSEPAALTSGPGDDLDPVVSPDGEWVVYAHQQTRWQLISSDPGTGRHEVVLERRSPIIIPAVAPDGRSVAWFSGTPTESNLFVVDLETGDWAQVTDGPERFATLPAWSGDGGRLFYFESNNESLRRVDRDGRNDVEAIPDFHWQNGQNWLSIEPGGERFVFQDTELQTRTRRTVVRSLAGEPDIVFDSPELRMPSWSRDGTRLLGVGPDGDIRVCDIAERSCESVLAAGQTVEGQQPRWSRDGSRIYFRRRTDDPGRVTIWRIDPVGGAPSKVLELGPIEANSLGYDIAAGDRIIWAKTSTDDSKIWRGRLRR